MLKVFTITHEDISYITNHTSDNDNSSKGKYVSFLVVIYLHEGLKLKKLTMITPFAQILNNEENLSKKVK